MDNKKYPISVTGIPCIGPCYEKGVQIIHPTTLELLTNKKFPFCPINETTVTEGGRTRKEYTDGCYVPTKLNTYSEKDLEMNILLPNISFTCNDFLKLYYNIYDTKSLFTWLDEHKNKPLGTRERVVGCSWKVLWNDMEILDDVFINFYIELIKKKWIRYVYPIIDKNIGIDKNKIYIGESKETKDNKIEKINFFIKNYITKNNIYKFLNDYYLEHERDHGKIDDHNKELSEYFVNYVKNLFNI